MFLVEQEV